MRPLTPRGPAGGGMPGPVVNRPMPRPTDMPGPVVNRLQTRMKKGGSASSRADGCAIRGKTKGKII